MRPPNKPQRLVIADWTARAKELGHKLSVEQIDSGSVRISVDNGKDPVWSVDVDRDGIVWGGENG